MTTDLSLRPTSTSLAPWTVADRWRQAALDWASNFSSPRTREAYLDALRGFFAFVAHNAPEDADPKTPDQVTQTDAIAYRLHLKTTTSPKTGRPYSQSTINQRLSAVSSFYRFAVERGLVATNPVDGVAREAVKPYGKATWLNTKEDDDKKLLALVDTSTVQGKRDKAILSLFLSRGLRVSEVAGLTVGDLFPEGATLKAKVKVKGGATKYVTLARGTAKAIGEYLSTRGDLTPDSPLFTATDRGRKAAAAIGRYELDEEKPLTGRSLGYLVKTYAGRLYGPGHRIHPHSLRHTAARRLDQEKVSFRAISSFLGHANGQVTTIYLQSIAADADEAVEALDEVYN